MSKSPTPKRKRSYRFTPGGVSHNRSGIWTANIDEKRVFWYGKVEIHGTSKGEVTDMREQMLKVLNG